MADKGYFVLTDISGYAESLTKSELDHARDALQNLFDVQLAHIRHPYLPGVRKHRRTGFEDGHCLGAGTGKEALRCSKRS